MVRKYEILAKNHMDQYFELLKKKTTRGGIENQVELIGHRQLSEAPRDTMAEYLAMEFFSRMLDNFHDFKDYCAQSEDPDCGVLDNDDVLIAEAIENWT